MNIRDADDLKATAGHIVDEIGTLDLYILHGRNNQRIAGQENRDHREQHGVAALVDALPASLAQDNGVGELAGINDKASSGGSEGELERVDATWGQRDMKKRGMEEVKTAAFKKSRATRRLKETRRVNPKQGRDPGDPTEARIMFRPRAPRVCRIRFSRPSVALCYSIVFTGGQPFKYQDTKYKTHSEKSREY